MKNFIIITTVFVLLLSATNANLVPQIVEKLVPRIVDKLVPRIVDKLVPRIVKGQEATSGQFPYQATIVMKESVNGVYEYIPLCGATIISTQWLVTAGHCFLGEDKRKLKVIVGVDHLVDHFNHQDRIVSDVEDRIISDIEHRIVSDIEDRIISDIEDRIVSDIEDRIISDIEHRIVSDIEDAIQHPKLSMDPLVTNDIAVAKLSSPLPLSSKIKPARLPKLNDGKLIDGKLSDGKLSDRKLSDRKLSDRKLIDDSSGVIVTSGFGATGIESRKMSKRLMWINVKIVNGSECASRYTYRGKSTFDDEQMICAGAEYGETTCDSRTLR